MGSTVKGMLGFSDFMGSTVNGMLGCSDFPKFYFSRFMLLVGIGTLSAICLTFGGSWLTVNGYIPIIRCSLGLSHFAISVQVYLSSGDLSVKLNKTSLSKLLYIGSFFIFSRRPSRES